MWLIYEGVSWNPAAAGGLSKEQFIERGLREGQYKAFSMVDQVQLLAAVYELLVSYVEQG